MNFVSESNAIIYNLCLYIQSSGITNFSMLHMFVIHFQSCVYCDTYMFLHYVP